MPACVGLAETTHGFVDPFERVSLVFGAPNNICYKINWILSLVDWNGFRFRHKGERAREKRRERERAEGRESMREKRAERKNRESRESTRAFGYEREESTRGRRERREHRRSQTMPCLPHCWNVIFARFA